MNEPGETWTSAGLCPWFMGSHGCDLAPGHDGEHKCMKINDDGIVTGICFEWAPGHEFEFTS